jgi:diacylglycerol kinase family enzyme
MDNNVSEDESVSFFLFINSKSGGGLGRKYLTIPLRRITYQFGKSTSIRLYFIDLFDEQACKRGLEKMGKTQAKLDKRAKGKVYTVVCGGDGTVLWVVSLVG